jgi:hypothetical protein
MRISSKRDDDGRSASAMRGVISKARAWLSGKTRSHLRQNALRGAIASLIETERMRLALTIARRHDG